MGASQDLPLGLGSSGPTAGLPPPGTRLQAACQVGRSPPAGIWGGNAAAAAAAAASETTLGAGGGGYGNGMWNGMGGGV